MIIFYWKKMAAISVVDLNNAARDVEHISAYATSSSFTEVDRLGNSKRTLAGVSHFADAMIGDIRASGMAVLASMGYLPPVPYTGGIVMTMATQTVQVGENTYAPLLNRLPFTTGNEFEASNWRVIEGLTQEILNQTTPSLVGTFRAPNDGVTSAQAAVGQAMISGKKTIVAEQGKYLVDTLTNPRGLEFEGAGTIVKSISGGLQQLNSYGDKNKYIFGTEYLAAFHKLLIAQNAVPTRKPLLLFGGDSTTAGDSTDVDYRLHTLVGLAAEVMGMQTAYGLNCINSGRSGFTTEQWRDTVVAEDMATNPDLYILRWGINDPGWLKNGSSAPLDAGQAYPGRRDPGDFAVSLRAGLAAIRASRNVASLSILLMTPNATSDTPNGRDEAWYEQIVPIIKQASRDFHCAFIDTYAFYRDARPAAGVWQDDVMPGGGRAIHPLNVMNTWISGLIADVIFPSGLKTKIGLANFRNLGGAQDAGNAERLPNYYAYGVTVSRAGVGFPVSGSVVTIRSADETVLQFLYPYADVDRDFYQFRIGAAAPLPGSEELPGSATVGFGPWKTVGGSSANVVAVGGFGGGNMRVASSGEMITIEGYISKSVAAPVGSDVLIGNLPAGMEPVRESVYVNLIAYDGSNSTGNFETLLAVITTSGQIRTRRASTLSVSRFYINAVWNLLP